MAIIHISRTASVDEIAAEMDRRGTVIETLEDEIERLRSQLAAARREAIEEAAQWHDQRARDTPDAFEMEFHKASAKTIRTLLDAPAAPALAPLREAVSVCPECAGTWTDEQLHKISEANSGFRRCACAALANARAALSAASATAEERTDV